MMMQTTISLKKGVLDMKLTWLGHACFKLESASGSAVFDPYEPGYVPGLRLPPLSADAVICSHGHRDHGYTGAVSLSGREPGWDVFRMNTFHDGVHGVLRGKNTVTLIDDEGLRLLHLGDLGHRLSPEQLRSLGRVDVLLVPVGGYYTIDAAAAADTVKALAPRVAVPMHYRGDGFGFDVLDTVDGFLKLCGNVRRFDTNVLELTPDMERCTAVLRCPRD